MSGSADLVVVGYARVPSGAALRSQHEFVTVVVRLNHRTNTVERVDSTAATGLIRNWITELLLGRDFSAGIDDVLDTIEHNYLSHASGALRQAVLDAWRRYQGHLDRPAGPTGDRPVAP